MKWLVLLDMSICHCNLVKLNQQRSIPLLWMVFKRSLYFASIITSQFWFPLIHRQEKPLLQSESNFLWIISFVLVIETMTFRYAVALSLKNKQRVIYTTPIKALSNQKYREFYDEFKDVGLVTGDVTINPSASCLIMTTEVCQNLNYS